MSKKIANEVIVAALLQHKTVAEAAQAAGISTRTLYDRMQTDEFQGLYTAARTEVYRHAVAHLSEKLTAAIDTVADIMQDEDVNPAVRLQAAQTIINNANKCNDRLTAEEQRTKNMLQTNRWDNWRL